MNALDGSATSRLPPDNMTKAKSNPQKREWFKTRATRNKVIKASSQEFSRHGYYNGSIRRISKKSGVQISSIYHHFKSKEELYRQVLYELHLQFFDYLSGHIKKGKTLEAELSSIFEAMMEYHVRHPEDAGVTFGLIFSSPRKFQEHYFAHQSSDYFKLVHSAFLRHRPRDSFLPKLYLVLDMLNSYLLRISVPDYHPDPDRIRQSLAFILRDA